MSAISPTVHIQQNIFLQYLEWHFCDQPRKILKTWKGFLLFNLNYFSLALLIKTFFSPWRQYVWAYPRGLDIPKDLEVFFSNMISRILGAILRIVIIFLGIFFEISILIIGFFVFFGWLILPALLLFILFRHV
jgi:hypothetical protein